MLRRLLYVVLAALMLVYCFAFSASAAEADYKDTGENAVGFASGASLFDAKRNTYTKAGKDASVTLTRNDGIAHIYIEFDRTPSAWTITDTESGATAECGKYGFLHEYVNVSELFGNAVKSVKLSFPEGTVISDIYGFSDGTLPDFVQTWEPPCEKADILVLTTHSDDEQLFFSGTLPYYAIERKLQVQIAYGVQHFEANGVKDHVRPHEQIDGLWTVGIRNYPVMSDIPDLYADSLQQAIANFGSQGVTQDDVREYLITCIRRFKPQVIVTHDLEGEYRHGAHMLMAHTMTEVIKYSDDASKFPESAEKYGTWAPLKTYLHLYQENKITLDWDTPYDSMGGLTPFQVSQNGFRCHKSQHWTGFYKWMYGTNDVPITKASQITKYSPCEFGLYDTRVGADVNKNDFMENITSYAQQKADAEALEAQKKAEEEQKRKEEEEKKAKEEAEKQKAEEEAQQKQEAVSEAIREQEEKNNVGYICIAVILSVAIFGIIILWFLQSTKRENKKKRKQLGDAE